MKKILMLTNEFYPYIGGVSTYVQNLAKTAVENGDFVTLISPDYGDQISIQKKFKEINIITYSGGKFKWVEMFKLIAVISRNYKNDRYNYAHICDWPFWIAYSLSPNTFNAETTIQTVYGSDILNLKRRKIDKVINLSKKFDRFVSISYFTKDLFQFSFPKYASCKPINVAYLGAENSWYQTCENTAKKKYVVSVSRLDNRKGLHYTIRAISRLAKHKRNMVKYLIIGEGDIGYKKKLMQLSKKCDVEVLFLGRLSNSEIRDIYCKSKVFVMPGDHNKRKVEGFGLSFLEAALSGLPTVTFDIGGSQEVVRCIGGVVCKFGDIESLGNHIEHFLFNEVDNDHIRNKAKDFSWKKCYLHTYK